MKLQLSVFLSLVILSSLTQAARAQTSADRLPPPVAHSKARQLAWEVARRDSRLSSVKIEGCRNHGANRFTCMAIERGSTSARLTTCRTRIRVGLAHGVPKASVIASRCQTERRLVFRSAAALAAVRPVVEEMASGTWGIQPMRRISLVELEFNVQWHVMRGDTPPIWEVCSANLRARLVSKHQVEVDVVSSRCETFQP